MVYYKEYLSHEKKLVGKIKLIDNNIYSFDIETTSYLILNGKQYKACDYQKLTEKEQELCEYRSCMYIWMFSINDIVYYGRTWEEFREFIEKINYNIPEKKIIFIHNLSFEFQYLMGNFEMYEVMARKKRHVMKCMIKGLNYELRCSYMMSNVALKKLPSMFDLPVEKMVGDLDYSLLRTPITPLTEKELGYCENDCLVIYYYILYELKKYETVDKIPLTSTGHVRRELKEIIMSDFKYKKQVKKSINIVPHIYNLLIDAFMGGYVHSSWVYTDTIINNVTSWDFTSSYPYVLVTYKYPSQEFRKCNIKRREEMSKRFAYLLVVKFKNIKCKFYNNFISQSKCRNIKGGIYDNGRVIQAEELEITLTDIDFYFILDTYRCKYEIIEIYFSAYGYLSNTFINFVLDKYVKKTEYKNVPGKEVEYQREKGLFNSLFGMSVTNTIRDEVIFDGKEWTERELSNQEILDSLLEEKNKSFMSFSTGVWVTAHARNNLLRNVIKLDDYVIYCDTDSIKLKDGYDLKVIEEYNESVIERINKTCKLLDIDISRYSPKDIYGKEHILGVFDKDAEYEEFITQGAKKYAYKYKKKLKDVEEDDNVIYKDNDYAHIIKITVSGVNPKKGSFQIKDLKEFKDDLVFTNEVTGKQMLIYCDNQEPFELIDYLGNKYKVTDKTGACVIPTTYVLSKSLEYANLISDNSSKRAMFNEL